MEIQGFCQKDNCQVAISTQIMQLPRLMKMRDGGHTVVLEYFKCPTTKQIRQDRQPLAASNAEKYNLTSIHLNGELICDP